MTGVTVRDGEATGSPLTTADQVPVCHLCGADRVRYLFRVEESRVLRCVLCGLTWREKGGQPDEGAGVIHHVDLARPGSETEEIAAAAYCDQLRARRPETHSVLVVAPQQHPLHQLARDRGFAVTSSSSGAVLAETPASSARFDAAIVAFELERVPDPFAFLRRLRDLLTEDGTLLVVTPSLDSLPARMLAESWTEWRPENSTYFDGQTIQSALLQAGFGQIEVGRDRRRYSLDHIVSRAAALRRTWLTVFLIFLGGLLSAALRSAIRVRIPSSCIVVTARCAPRRERPVLSIVMPVFNERATFERTIERVLAKQIDGIDKEVIVVESNSTDGTRDAVLRYQDAPGVRLLLQDRPAGKGNAVRAGLAVATGDFVLIQDADDEYDVEDYDGLVEPLRRYQRAFVLGSRHTGSWKIRQFTDQTSLSAVLNLGHLVFLLLFNVLYGQRLNDPFTMYKVFRRDCLHGMTLECNRFDFDFEIVIKLIRKGYRPVEIPVNYRARSFSEGKKVSAFRDPLTWIVALVKYRF
jgi:hypothetical protein